MLEHAKTKPKYKIDQEWINDKTKSDTIRKNRKTKNDLDNEQNALIDWRHNLFYTKQRESL